MSNSRLAHLQETAQRVANELELRADQRVVFVESCTGGMVSAALAGIPGISRFLCGSMVTYRGATKSAWLGIPADVLERFSAESAIVTESLALEVLSRTPEARWSIGITGHLGPDAPVEKDGFIFIAVARQDTVPALVSSQTFQLVSQSRADRQLEAATLALSTVLNLIANGLPAQRDV